MTALVALDAGTLPAGSGRKAENLAWLHRKGFRVPSGWVVPATVADAEVAALVAGALAGDTDTAWAVRSSADVEDGGTSTFAGQFLSVLEVRGADAVAASVADVRASAHAAAAGGYAQQAGVDAAAIRMGVVIQRMATPVVSGVAFSRNPLSGLDEVVIEAVPGRGITRRPWGGLLQRIVGKVKFGKLNP